MKPMGHVAIVAIIYWASSNLIAVGQGVEIEWRSHTAKGIKGVSLEGEIGTIVLPLRHSMPDDGTLQISFVRFRTDHPNPRAPIFFLAGGPGGSGIELAATVATHPHLRLIEHADVIGVDQRGTGLSRPNLMEPSFNEDLPWSSPPDRKDYLDAFQRCVADCMNHCNKSGIDIKAFNTQESCRDIDCIRESLGYSKVILFGSSYGSHLGLAYLSHFESNVDRAILTKVEGLGDTWKYPSTVQAVLEQLDSECREDPFYSSRIPSLQNAIVTLRERLRDGNTRVIMHVETDNPREIILSEYELMMAVSNWLTDLEEIKQLPRRLLAFLNGDWQELAEFSAESRRVSIQAMPLLMDCASGASAQRQQQIETERNDPRNLLQDALSAPFFWESCRECGDIDLGDDFRQGKRSDVPILFVSGTLDVRTPVFNVERILANHSQTSHVVVRNASHDSRELMSVEYRRLLQSFLRGESVSSCEITLPKVFFDKPE